MAESQRKAPEVTAAVDDEAQTKKDRMMLLIFGIGAVAIIGLMFWLSSFLSG